MAGVTLSPCPRRVHARWRPSLKSFYYYFGTTPISTKTGKPKTDSYVKLSGVPVTDNNDLHCYCLLSSPVKPFRTAPCQKPKQSSSINTLLFTEVTLESALLLSYFLPRKRISHLNYARLSVVDEDCDKYVTVVRTRQRSMTSLSLFEICVVTPFFSLLFRLA